MKAAVIAAVATLAFGPLSAMAQEPGHCKFNLKNMFAGPYKACFMPATPEKCTELGTTDENSDAVHGAGACPAAGVVGTCDAGANGKTIYYDGDAGGLEIGCGFQGGEWKAGG
jgi:hypothetical protein